MGAGGVALVSVNLRRKKTVDSDEMVSKLESVCVCVCLY